MFAAVCYISAVSLHGICLPIKTILQAIHTYLPYVSVPSNVRVTTDITTSRSGLLIVQAGYPPAMEGPKMHVYMTHCEFGYTRVWVHDL